MGRGAASRSPRARVRRACLLRQPHGLRSLILCTALIMSDPGLERLELAFQFPTRCRGRASAVDPLPPSTDSGVEYPPSPRERYEPVSRCGLRPLSGQLQHPYP